MKEHSLAIWMWLILVVFNALGVSSLPWIVIFIIPLLYYVLYLICTAVAAEHLQPPEEQSRSLSSSGQSGGIRHRRQ